MTIYTACLRADSEFASHEIEADTLEQGLSNAQKLYADDPCELWFEPYDGMPSMKSPSRTTMETRSPFGLTRNCSFVLPPRNCWRRSSKPSSR
jgi:hypothetical protein